MSDFDWTPHLNEGEEVLWQGRPSPRLFVFRAYDGFLLPFSVFFGVVGGAVAILGALNDVVMMAVGLIFLAVALYMGLGRFLVSQTRRKRTCYALTSKRALMMEGNKAPDAKALTSDLAITQRRDRVTFGPPVPALTNKSSRAAMVGGDADFTFCGLDDAKTVADLAGTIVERQS